MSHVKKISRTLYFASHNPKEACDLLRSKGISVSSEQDTENIAEGLTRVVKKGSEADLSDVVKIHPDYEMIKENLVEHEGYIKKSDVKEEIKAADSVTAPATTNIIMPNPLISKGTVSFIGGVVATLTVLYLIKNNKSN